MSRTATVPAEAAEAEPVPEASSEPLIRAVPAPPDTPAAAPDGAPDPPPPAGEPASTAVPPPSPDPPAADPPATDPPATEPAATTPPARGGRRGRRGLGLRERRRQQTRARIVDAAAGLFAERGFDAVSVAEIAQRAGVVEKTVFNHFPVKEGLVFDADPPVREALLDAVRRRPPGEPVTAAAGSFVVAAVAVLAAPEAADGVAGMARIVRGSPTLQVREREILGELTNALAALITEETRAEPGDLQPWLAAHAVLGLYAALLERVRDRVLAGARGPELAAELRANGRRGLSLLQLGLAGYAKRR